VLIRTLVCVPLAFLVTIALPGSEASLAQTKAEVSLTFQDLGPVLTASTVGMSPDASLGAPSPAVLADGQVRLYYNSEVGTDPGTAGIFSAISTNGVQFAPENGERFHYTPQPLHVEHLPDGSWRLYYAENAPPPARGADGIASAISSDGLSFTAESGLRLANPVSGTHLSCCAIVRLADGRYRMYADSQLFVPGSPPGPPQIYSAVSSDLLNWTLEPGVRLNGRDPAALMNSDGSTLLVFTIPGTGIETATSADGVTFASPRPTNLTSSDLHDLALVTLPDGRLVMYYDSGTPTTIGAAVASRVTAPSVSYPSPAATAVTATSARISAIVDPHGALTRYAFEYGKSTAYGTGTDLADLPNATGPRTVGATLLGLSSSTTYHFRANAFNSVGNGEGADQTFTTGMCRLPVARDRGWEVATAHAATQKAAAKLLRRARGAAHGAGLVERDGCANYEAAIAGLNRKGSAAALRRAKKLGFRKATVERT
jgi:hypothetical protein